MSSHALDGVCRAIVKDATSIGAGATYVSMRPNPGEAWEILAGWLYQDDGAVDMGFKWVDPDQAEFTFSQATVGANQRLWLGATTDALPTNFAAPMVSTYDRYFRAYFIASAIAKTGYCCFMVREFRGIAPEA